MSCPCQVYSKVSELRAYPLVLDYFTLDLKAIVLSSCAVQLPGDSDTLPHDPCLGGGVKTTAEDPVVQPLCCQQDGEAAQLGLEPSLAVFGSSAGVCSAASSPGAPQSQTEPGSTPNRTTRMLCDPRGAVKLLLNLSFPPNTTAGPVP